MSEAVLPAPLVPAWVDLRSYDWFHFYHKRLRQSEFWKSASDQACRISVDFWSAAYEQVPAGSVPNSDHILSEWAGFGRRDLSGWLAAKDEVLSAWTLCSDGRWYHPTLSEVARKAGVERRKHLWAKECDRIRKENIRRQKAGSDPLLIPPKPSDDPWTGGAFQENSDGKPTAKVDAREDDYTNSTGRPVECPQNPSENALRERGRKREVEGVTRASARDGSPAVVPTDRAKPSKRGRPPKTLVPWPLDFELTPELREYATKHGFDGDWLFEKFRNKALSKGWEYRDWPAAFRNFAQSERSYAPQGRSNGTHQDQAWRPPDV